MPESFHPQYGRILQMYNEANAVILILKIKKSLHGCTLSKSIASLSIMFICSFTYTCVCILIQALDKSLQRRTYYHFSIRLDFIFLGKPTRLIMLCYWSHNMNACNFNVWDEKPQINLVIWNMIFEFLSQLHESNLAYIFSLRMVLAHAVQWNLTYLKYVSM